MTRPNTYQQTPRYFAFRLARITANKRANPIQRVVRSLSCMVFDKYAMSEYDVAVVGGDTVCNLIAAFQLAKSGRTVLLYDRLDIAFPPGSGVLPTGRVSYKGDAFGLYISEILGFEIDKNYTLADTVRALVSQIKKLKQPDGTDRVQRAHNLVLAPDNGTSYSEENRLIIWPVHKSPAVQIISDEHQHYFRIVRDGLARVQPWDGSAVSFFLVKGLVLTSLMYNFTGNHFKLPTYRIGEADRPIKGMQEFTTTDRSNDIEDALMVANDTWLKGNNNG